MIEKTCRRCRNVKPVDDFYENKYSPDGRYAFCKVCFDQFAQKLKEKEKEKASAPKIIKQKPCDLPEKERKAPKSIQEPVSKPVQKTTPEPALETGDEKRTRKPEQEQARKSEQPQAPERVQEPADHFDFIEYLIENQALEKKAALEILKIPKQITKITARKRICNGCGKTEEIDQVEKNTVIPVHAWFCDFCKQRETKRRVRKGTTVQDYWGREFKVKKIISNDLAMGVLKNKNGKWEKRSLKIYGRWETSKD
jgi:hypothetical protein